MVSDEAICKRYASRGLVEYHCRIGKQKSSVIVAMISNLLTNTASIPRATNGGLKGALIDFNLSAEAAEYFLESVKAGGLLFSIRTADERASEAAGILRAHKAERLITTAE
jgi:hypothetical protein